MSIKANMTIEEANKDALDQLSILSRQIIDRNDIKYRSFDVLDNGIEIVMSEEDGNNFMKYEGVFSIEDAEAICLNDADSDEAIISISYLDFSKQISKRTRKIRKRGE